MSTRKPHEEEWTLDGDGDVRRKNRRGDMTTLVCLKAATGELEAQALIAAAPEMARALLATGEIYEVTPDREEWHQDACIRANPIHGCDPECAVARAALTKAGVPIS